MSQLNGFISVPVSKIHRALKFAEQYSEQYTKETDQLFQQAIDILVKQHTGKRSLKRAFYLVPTTKTEAFIIAHEQLVYGNTRMWHRICRVTGTDYGIVQRKVTDAAQLLSMIADLRSVFNAGHHLDDIQLDIKSCCLLQDIIDLANEAHF